MAKQKFIVWSMKKFSGVKAQEPGVLDLDIGSLSRTYPELAEMIGGGVIVSHSVVDWGHDGPLVTFVVNY